MVVEVKPQFQVHQDIYLIFPPSVSAFATFEQFKVASSGIQFRES